MALIVLYLQHVWVPVSIQSWQCDGFITSTRKNNVRIMSVEIVLRKVTICSLGCYYNEYTSHICSFEKATYTTNCFKVSFYKVCLSDTAVGVGCWDLNPGSKLPTSVWFSRHFARHFQRKLSFDGNWILIPVFHYQGRSNVLVFHKFVSGRVVCQWNLVGKWWCAGGSYPTGIAVPLSAASELKVCVPCWRLL